ncbi:Aste57867_8661 [Aphanomyces stellatus]|uniref:Aste57867_8661 protein n=1 Tax=Aphanomyces stellatus TaxID=120398 RepID=A0A485KKX1_9STRA|nr:hypothetical protein As57867_008627 [Aphanomyces stellatus]VFT85547.1 Aste57867_8661 [Aphanomyces stellatus]
MKLPLPANYFQCPPLAQQTIDQLNSRAHNIAMTVVQNSLVQSSETISWSQVTSSTTGLQIYKATDARQTNPNIKLYVGVAEVAGTIDEAVELFRYDTTERAKAYVARIGKGLLDSANLYTLAEPSVDRPHDSVAINWTALQSPVKAVVMPRDSCHLEGQFEFDHRGKRGWVRALKSIDVACCPDMQQSHGLIRMHQLGSGHVFLESDRKGYLRIAYIVHSVFNISGFGSDWAVEKAIKRRCASLLDFDTFLRENRLATGKFLLGDQLVPKDMRHACQLCHKKFGLFVSKTNCFKCGEVFCGDCNTAWTVPVNGVQTRIEACKKCALKRPSHRSTSHASSRSYSTRSKGSAASFLKQRTPSSSSTSRWPTKENASPDSPMSTASTATYSDHRLTNESWIQEFVNNTSLVEVDAVSEQDV